MNDKRIVNLAREAASSPRRFKPQEDGGDPPRAGDIRLARPVSSSAETQRLVLVLRVNKDFNFAEVCLLSNETDMASDFDVILSRRETGLPFQLMAELDLTASLYLKQLGSLFGDVESGFLIENLRAASSGDPLRIQPSLRGLAIRGPKDPRWDFKEAELVQLQELSRECTRDLVEGRATSKTVVDPALLDEIVISADSMPDECTRNLLSVLLAGKGGLRAVPQQIIRLNEKLRGLLIADHDLQVAMQPLLEIALTEEISMEGARSHGADVTFSLHRKRIGDDSFQRLREAVFAAAAEGCGYIIPLLTSENEWEEALPADHYVPIDVPGHGQFFAEVCDPRRAA